MTSLFPFTTAIILLTLVASSANASIRYEFEFRHIFENNTFVPFLDVLSLEVVVDPDSVRFEPGFFNLHEYQVQSYSISVEDSMTVGTSGTMEFSTSSDEGDLYFNLGEEDEIRTFWMIVEQPDVPLPNDSGAFDVGYAEFSVTELGQFGATFDADAQVGFVELNDPTPTPIPEANAGITWVLLIGSFLCLQKLRQAFAAHPTNFSRRYSSNRSSTIASRAPATKRW